MGIWGKILGGAAGFALGGPLGALIGTAAGHAYDSFRAEQIETEIEADTGVPSVAKQTAFAIAVIALCAKMARVDGRVTRDEVEAFRDVFQVAPDEAAHVRLVFDLARKDARGFEAYARQAARLFRDSPAVLEQLLGGLFHVARADGTVQPEEIEYLRRVAEIFGFDDAAFRRLRDAHLGADPEDPYHVLGLPPDADDETVRQRWRALIREHHPDRLIANGMPEEFVRIATARLAAINAMYDRIRAERGMA